MLQIARETMFILLRNISFIFLVSFVMESGDSCYSGDGRALGADGRAQALVGPGLATPLILIKPKHSLKILGELVTGSSSKVISSYTLILSTKIMSDKQGNA